MINFEYYNPARIIFGKGVENEVGKEVARYGKRILLHYGGGSIKRNGLYDRVVASLQAEGLFFIELGGVQPNPRLSLVRKGIELCKEHDIDFILAVGGGSTIDSSKAIAAGVCCKDDIWEYYLYDDKPIEGALPVGVVLTIPAAGSESSDSSVVTNEEGNYKRYIGSEYLIPKFAFMNPEVTFSMPAHQIANGCSDIGPLDGALFHDGKACRFYRPVDRGIDPDDPLLRPDGSGPSDRLRHSGRNHVDRNRSTQQPAQYGADRRLGQPRHRT